MVTVWLCFALIGVIGKLPLAARWDYWGPLIEFISAYRYLLALQLTPHRPSLVDLYGFFSKTKASFDSLPLAKPPFGPRMITVVQINILARELMGDMFKNSNDQLALIAILSFQVSSRCSAATALLSFALCFLFSLSSSSQLLLYFTAIKPGNFNQVAQREFLQGQERSEPLFNAVVLSFLFFSPLHLISLFFHCWTQPWLFIVYDSISNLSSRTILLVGGAVVLFLCVCTILAFGIHRNTVLRIHAFEFPTLCLLICRLYFTWKSHWDGNRSFMWVLGKRGEML